LSHNLAMKRNCQLLRYFSAGGF